MYILIGFESFRETTDEFNRGTSTHGTMRKTWKYCKIPRHAVLVNVNMCPQQQSVSKAFNFDLPKHARR